MARVQMLLYVSGGRADGSDWPERGGILECEEQEARDLVKGSLAAWVPDEEHAEIPAPGAEQPAPAPAAGSAGDDEPPDPENGSEDDSDPSKPRVRDPKDAWEAHAVTLGATPEMVAAMTKADLVAQFGASS